MDDQVKKQPKPNKEQSPGFARRIRGFFVDLRGEARKIIWPSRKELQSKTVTVIVTCLIFAAIIFCIDSVYNLGLQVFAGFLG